MSGPTNDQLMRWTTSNDPMLQAAAVEALHQRTIVAYLTHALETLLDTPRPITSHPQYRDALARHTQAVEAARAALREAGVTDDA